MNYINGKILTDSGFKKGYILQKNQEKPKLHLNQHHGTDSKKHLIVPTMINAHTHIGDTFIRQKNVRLPQDIESLVAPPNGLKHILLKKTSKEVIIKGMIKGLDELEKEGVSTFIDYRENGLEGIAILKKALEKTSIHTIILSRPSSDHTSTRELTNLLKESDGIGLSSVEDYLFEEVAFVAEVTKKANKLLSFHVSERIREQIDRILQLDPDFIVHMTQATKRDLELVKKKKIPIVVCPRSNDFFKMKANLERMKAVGNQILLGSDNFMLFNPSILQEIKFIDKHFPRLFSIEELLKMATYEARKALNLKDSIPGSKFPTSWMVIDPIDYQIVSILKEVEEG